MTLPDSRDYAATVARAQGANAAADPLLQAVLRPVRALLPSAPLRDALEILRTSPYRAVPVVTPPDETGKGGGILLSLISERTLALALVTAATPTERAQLLQLPVGDFRRPPVVVLTANQRASEAALVFAQTSVEDALPVIDPFTQAFRGLITPADLVHEMVRPFRPPTLGGMATLRGVYLTTGAVSGGVGAAALAGYGLALFFTQEAIVFAFDPLQQWAANHLPQHNAYIEAFWNGGTLLLLLTTLALLTIVRFTPIAGYHAAEHQVVHAIERGEPLLIPVVRSMPRVHPRCGTNLTMGLTLVMLGGSLAPLLSVLNPSLGTAGWILGGIAALAWWRSLGSWVQEHLTTRPATERQIESGIQAAREVLARYSRAPYASPRPIQRLWRMGLVQIIVGYALGYGLLALAARLIPGAQPVLGPLLS